MITPLRIGELSWTAGSGFASLFFQLKHVEVDQVQVNDSQDAPNVVFDAATVNNIGSQGNEILISEPWQGESASSLGGVSVKARAEPAHVRMLDDATFAASGTDDGLQDPGDHDCERLDTDGECGSHISPQVIQSSVQPKQDVPSTNMVDVCRQAERCVKLIVSRVWQGQISGGTVFAVRRHGEALTPSNIQDSVDIGLFPVGEPLMQVSGLLEQVFMPLLSQMPGTGHEKATAQGASGQDSVADAELSAALEKYVSQLHTSEAHLTGSVQLAFPAMAAAAFASKDDDTLAALESCVHDWTLILQEVKMAEREKMAQGDGPLDEIHFWREKNNILGGLHEQIHMPRAERILECASQHASINVFDQSFCAAFGPLPTFLTICAGTLKGTQQIVRLLPPLGAMWQNFQSSARRHVKT